MAEIVMFGVEVFGKYSVRMLVDNSVDKFDRWFASKAVDGDNLEI